MLYKAKDKPGCTQVLEPQLMVALGSNVKHLIMIGDHKQLPPQVRHFFSSFISLLLIFLDLAVFSISSGMYYAKCYVVSLEIASKSG